MAGDVLRGFGSWSLGAVLVLCVPGRRLRRLARWGSRALLATSVASCGARDVLEGLPQLSTGGASSMSGSGATAAGGARVSRGGAPSSVGTGGAPVDSELPPCVAPCPVSVNPVMVNVPSGVFNIQAFDGAAPDDVWAVGMEGTKGGPVAYALHWNGTAWQPRDVPLSAVFDVRAFPSGHVLLAGFTNTATPNGYALLEWDGVSWREWPMPTDPDGRAPVFEKLSGSSPDDVWAVNFGTIDAPGFSVAHLVRGNWEWYSMGAVADIYSQSPGDVWAVGGRVVSHFDGSGTWTSQPLNEEDMDLTAVWASGARDVWASGHGIAHFDGSRWTTTRSGAQIAAQFDDVPPQMPSTASLTSVSGRGPNDVWFAGDIDAVVRWNAVAWRWERYALPDTEHTPLCVFANERDVWIGGRNVLFRAQ